MTHLVTLKHDLLNQSWSICDAGMLGDQPPLLSYLHLITMLNSNRDTLVHSRTVIIIKTIFKRIEHCLNS